MGMRLGGWDILSVGLRKVALEARRKPCLLPPVATRVKTYVNRFVVVHQFAARPAGSDRSVSFEAMLRSVLIALALPAVSGAAADLRSARYQIDLPSDYTVDVRVAGMPALPV